MTTEEHIELARAAGRAPDAVTALQAAGATTQQVRRALGRALGISPRAVEAAIRASSMRTQSRTDASKVYLDSDFIAMKRSPESLPSTSCAKQMTFSHSTTHAHFGRYI